MARLPMIYGTLKASGGGLSMGSIFCKDLLERKKMELHVPGCLYNAPCHASYKTISLSTVWWCAAHLKFIISSVPSGPPCITGCIRYADK